MVDALDLQFGGSHYKKYGIQPVEFIAANRWDFFAACILKYLLRWRDKSGFVDLDKARHFVDLRILLVERAPLQRGRLARFARWLLGAGVQEVRQKISMNRFIRANQLPPCDDVVLLALNLWVNGAIEDAAFIHTIDHHIEKMKRTA